ncbi:galactosyl transferase GMA12/MNN10 family-domain-containing protein [Protomyces lactucae-debilis]|uniref:Galactosyl transferase GMA12/MNN10 family-domain-containing protein n=1 Tax=Protomyces lactucae-debilis TaxID=2754530 RepID=A0A1Y2FLY8_PROLT|nr:galactosyl transferase GMA12/MNN10 family-domain-containing protein [Protomyces lactucae-debilis]ORY84968.1 galactosyl transferase GMA12/MNN10 family-domain-containing protein [Protomyces lactucae-debilis]
MSFALHRQAMWRRGKVLVGVLLFIFIVTTKVNLDNRKRDSSSTPPRERSPTTTKVNLDNRKTDSSGTPPVDHSPTVTPTPGSPAKVKQRVAMVTSVNYRWNWEGAQEAFELSAQERQAYAALHGYSFDVIDVRSFKQDLVDPSWHVQWMKIPIVKHIFEKYPDADWVWWLDADAIIMGNQDLDSYLFDRIESLQAEARQFHSDNRREQYGMAMFKYLHNITLAETNLIVTPDMDTPMINIGSFLIRRSETWTDMLLDLWADPLFHKAAEDRAIGFQEQGVLAHLIQQHKTIARHTAMVPMTSINAFAWAGPWTWRPDSLVMHEAGCYVHALCRHWMREYRAVKKGEKDRVGLERAIRDTAWTAKEDKV